MRLPAVLQEFWAVGLVLTASAADDRVRVGRERRVDLLADAPFCSTLERGV